MTFAPNTPANSTLVASSAATSVAGKTTLSIILAVSACHLINDVMQSLLAAIYPILKDS